MKIKIGVEQGPLGETNHGIREFRYAIIDKFGNTITPFFRCRDYILDIFWAHYTGKSMSIYGYVAQPSLYAMMMDDGKFRIAIKIQKKGAIAPSVHSTEETHEDVEPVGDDTVYAVNTLLRMYETALGFSYNDCQKSEGNKHIIITVDEKWAKVPYVVSTLILLLRLSYTYNPKESFIEQFSKKDVLSAKFLSPNDQMYFRQCKTTLEDLLLGKVDDNSKYKPEDNDNQVHNYYGIVTHSQLKEGVKV